MTGSMNTGCTKNLTADYADFANSCSRGHGVEARVLTRRFNQLRLRQPPLHQLEFLDNLCHPRNPRLKKCCKNLTRKTAT
jgi:hypothetical protein